MASKRLDGKMIVSPWVGDAMALMRDAEKLPGGVILVLTDKKGNQRIIPFTGDQIEAIMRVLEKYNQEFGT